MSRDLQITVVDSSAALERHTAAWDELIEHAAEPNPFYEPQSLLPAWRCLAPATLSVVLVWNAASGATPQLAGLFPIVRQQRFRALPLPVASMWQHLYSYLATPLLRRGETTAVVDAFLTWLHSQTDAALFESRSIPCDGEFHRALCLALARRQRKPFETARHARALFLPAASADAYLDAAMAGKRRKELRRQERRLAELGRLEYEHGAGDGDAWVDEFLALEASGWKGRERSALRDDAAAVTLFRDSTRAARARNRWMGLALRLDGRAVAMKCNLLAGDGAVAFKIAYDEQFARFSPGVLLEIEHLRVLHRPGAPAWMDSGAAARHPMIDHLWRHRLAIGSFVAPTGRASGVLGVAALPVLRWAARSSRQLLGRTTT